MSGIDFHTGWPYLVGGLIICFAITLNASMTKRLLSLSTMINDLLTPERADFSWKTSALAGLIFASTLMWNIIGFDPIKNTKITPFETEKEFLSGLGLYGFIFSGFLVGCGTRLAGGGITGHAFCGIPRFSLKSLLAVLSFLGTGFLVATMKHKSSFLTGNDMSCVSIDINPTVLVNVCLAISLAILLFSLFRRHDQEYGVVGTLVSFIAGAILSIGLLVSGLAQRHQVIDFLTFKESWNTMFLFVFIGAAGGNLITFNLLLRKQIAPAVHPHFIHVILGSAIFGAGLGLSGLTPGTALLVTPVYYPEVLVFFLLPASFGHQFGGYIAKWIDNIRGSSDNSHYGEF